MQPLTLSSKSRSGLHTLSRALTVATSLVLFCSGTLTAQGTDDYQAGSSAVRFGSLLPVVSETGQLSMSIDAAGSNGASHLVQVEKPSSGATVRGAYLAAASTGFSGYVIPNGGVLLNGTPISWSITTPSSISSWNHWANVTSIVKPIMDAAPVGQTNFTLVETNTTRVDGEILAVIFDNPATALTTTVILNFGAQAIAGDTFSIGLANPINLADPNLRLDFSLGISYGAQPGGQVSTVDVNGARLSSSAGGQDDGALANGALITVGGLGDSTANPVNPFAGSTSTRTDDELYDLRPFVSSGATLISVFTRNPSNDDNILFAALQVSGPAIVGEGIVLAPTFAEKATGTTHTLTARVQNTLGNPIVGRTVHFEVIAGPHLGLTGSGVTNVLGEANFTYLGSLAGNDRVVARFTNSQSQIEVSNEALVRWIVVNTPPTCTETFADARANFLEPTPESFLVTEGHTIVVPITVDDIDGDVVTVSLSGPAGATLGPITSGPAPYTTYFSWTPTAADKAAAPYAITITVTDDDNATATCTFGVADINLNPVCDAGGVNGRLTVQCTSPSGTPVQLNGTASDADDANLTFHWDVSDTNVALNNSALPNPSGVFPDGITMATLTVTDGRGGLASCDVEIEVVDTLPPEVRCSTNIGMLWPPNHTMRSVQVMVLATDTCSLPSAIVPVSVTVRSSESDESGPVGDGRTSGDVNGHDGFTAPVNIMASLVYDTVLEGYVTTIQLRAERQGTGTGRKYTIDVVAVDSNNNVGTSSCCVIVPHDRRSQ